MPTAQFRMSRTALVPVFFLLLCSLPITSALPWGLLVLLLPVVVAAWVVRRGVDVTDDGIVARSLAGEHRLAWSEVAGIRVAERGELYVVTTRHTEMRLPVLRARDLPALAAASGGRIEL